MLDASVCSVVCVGRADLVDTYVGSQVRQRYLRYDTIGRLSTR
jgi:hypothetical protein